MSKMCYTFQIFAHIHIAVIRYPIKSIGDISDSNRNEYQEYLLGVKAAGA
jgi:hypothetical protein